MMRLHGIYLSRKSGFTLIELVVLIGVVAILALVMVPNATAYVQKADDARHAANVRGVYAASEMSVQTDSRIYIKDMISNKDVLEPEIAQYANVESDEIIIVSNALSDVHTMLNKFFVSPTSKSDKIMVRYNTDRMTYIFNGSDDVMEPNEGQPSKPVEPEKPIEPGKPVESATPDKPVDPAEPAEPVTPDKPGKPDNSKKPEHIEDGITALEAYDIFKSQFPDSMVKEFEYERDDREYELEGFYNGMKSEMEIDQRDGRIKEKDHEKKKTGKFIEITRELVKNIDRLVAQAMGMRVSRVQFLRSGRLKQSIIDSSLRSKLNIQMVQN